MASSARVWGIPCPVESGTQDRFYPAWFWLYKTNQQVRHKVGLHAKPVGFSIAPRCDWCGHRSRKQRAIADANRGAFDGSL